MSHSAWRNQEQADPHTGRMPRAGQSSAAMGQGAARSWERVLEPLEGAWPCQYLDLALLASRNFSCSKSPNSLWQFIVWPEETDLPGEDKECSGQAPAVRTESSKKYSSDSGAPRGG